MSGLVHFAGLATTLALAKVLLNTVAAALFLVHEGPEQLPLFYVLLAVTMVLFSFGLSVVIDRLPRVRLAQAALAGGLLVATALRWPVALDVPGVYFVLLASAHLYEIVLDIVLWVVIAGFTDSVGMKRATPFIYMALAIGGALGGGAARLLSSLLSTADMLWLLPALAMTLVAQLELVGRRLHEVPDIDSADRSSAGVVDSITALIDLVRRFPLSLLIALNALVLTILYGLSEYLVFFIYSAQFPEEQELIAFLALVFALLQTIEFVLLYALSRPLLERAGPLVRNLVFPLTSFASLLYLLASQKLPAALILHVNAEAVSNAIFQPVNNANYIPLPLRLHGRARTLSDGIFYPTGLALAGAILVLMPEEGATPAVGFVAIVFVLVFVLFSAGAGLLFLPTMRANVGSGLIRSGVAASVAMPAPRVRALLESRERELRLLGLSLAQQLGPAGLEHELHALAAHPDRATRAALAALITAAPGLWARDFLDGCLAGENQEQLKLALVVMLSRQTRPKPDGMRRALGARDPAVVALGHVAAHGVGAWPKIQPLVRSSRTSSDLVDAIASAQRTDLAPLLLECLPTAEPEQQRRALVLLNGCAAAVPAATSAIVRRLAKHRDSAVRAEATVLLSRTGSRLAAVRQLVAALDDPDGRVRRRAAEALCHHGDRAAALLRHRLRELTTVCVDGVWVLAQLGSPQARRVLAAYLGMLQQEAERSTRLLEWIAASPDRAGWAALELCLRDHQACMVDVVLATLSPSIELRLARQLRAALRGSDQRSRASGFELIAAVPASQRPAGAVALLRHLLFEDRTGTRRPGSWGAGGPEPALALAMASMSPWVRRAATLSLERLLLSPPGPLSASVAGPVKGRVAGDRAMELDDQEFERIVTIKRMPLFRYVPFETIAEVARSVQVRTYLAGEEVSADGTRRQDLLMLEAGALTIALRNGAEILAAPACFGEVALCGERMSWPRITALEEARVSFLRAAIFEELCREHPEIAIELCRLLARRLRQSSEAQAGTGD